MRLDLLGGLQRRDFRDVACDGRRRLEVRRVDGRLHRIGRVCSFRRRVVPIMVPLVPSPAPPVPEVPEPTEPEPTEPTEPTEGEQP